MSLPIQMIHIHYRGKFLDLLDSDDHTPLYNVKVCAQAPQMEMYPAATTTTTTTPKDEPKTRKCTASFKNLSLDVKMNIHGREITFERESMFTRTYNFTSPEADSKLTWEADGALTGDYKLHGRSRQVLARFRNKLFSCSEVGSFEIVGQVSEKMRDEIIISGLALLAMVQSLNLAAMVLGCGSVSG